METKHKRDKIMRGALVILVSIVVIFAGSLIFAGKKSLKEDPKKDLSSAKALDERLSRAVVNIGGSHLTASIADTNKSREKGLSGVRSIGPNEGKIFIFEDEAHHGIWMKDMKFPLDVIWVNKQNTVVDIRENIAPESYPDTFIPAYPASKTIEVNAGWVTEHNVKVGDTIMFTELQG